MKKILFGVFAGLISVNAFAACNTPVTVSYVGNQKPADDEFLYVDEREWNLAYQGYVNSGEKNSGAGRAYECDMGNSGGCKRNDVITLGPGHVFQGTVVKKELKYQCKNPGLVNNKWVVVEDGMCHTKGFGDVAVGNCVSDGSGGCRKLTDIDCSGYELSDNAGVEFKGVCFEGPRFKCIATKCRAGMKPDVNGVCSGDSVEVPVQPVKPDNPEKPVKPTLGKCHSSVCTTELCKACCAKPGTETIWTPSVNKCVCVNGGDFVKEGNQWLCKVSAVIAPNPEKYTCDSTLLGRLAGWKAQCANFVDVLTQISALETYCATNPDKDVFLRLYDELRDAVDTTCVTKSVDDSATITLIGTAKTRIQVAVDSLKSFASGLDVSKWKDEEGKFNTARLASDVTAGVVLGTAGALITSSVVKKHQVEEGFEDISCTIGGQTVAGWGDEFTVGVH